MGMADEVSSEHVFGGFMTLLLDIHGAKEEACMEYGHEEMDSFLSLHMMERH